MLLPKHGGRKTLRETLTALLDEEPNPTFASLVEIFERVSRTHQITDTELNVAIVAWPVAKRLKPYVDVALALGFGETSDEWDEPPGHLMLCFKARAGVLGFFGSRYNGYHDPDTDLCMSTTFASFRQSNLFRWFGARNAYDIAVHLTTPDDYFTAMTKLLPVMREAGLVCCCDENDTGQCSLEKGG